MKTFTSFLREAMDKEKILTTMSKFNPAQRQALRKKYYGRNITGLFYDPKIDHVQVHFDGKVAHDFFLGKNGAMKHHKILSISGK